MTVRRNLPANHDQKKPYVEALDEIQGRSASAFQFRIQDPMHGHALDHALAELQKEFIVHSVKIIGIEVAFDTYSKGASVLDLAEIVTDRYRFLTAAPREHWYFYRTSGDGRHYIDDDRDSSRIGHRRDLVECFAEGWQLTDCNNQEAPIRFHAYVKTVDNGRPLLPDDYRARLEITLQGDALPFVTVEDLKRFDFTSLSKFFKFRRPADNLHPIVRRILTHLLAKQIGLKSRYRRPNRKKPGTYSGTSEYRCSTVADEELNDISYECLRQLTRDWRKKPRVRIFRKPSTLNPLKSMKTGTESF